MKEICTKEEYLNKFPSNGNQDSIRAKALNSALDIRKFEIDLYWKRASYFWTFIGATFAGYFVLLNAKEPPADILVLLNCLGLIFSVSWYFVNRGSKFWQKNWEKHVDMLEDEIIGPLYKMHLNKSKLDFWALNQEYGFSVSKISQALSLYVVGIWLFLTSRSVFTFFEIYEPFDGFNILLVVLYTIISVYCFVKYSKTNLDDTKIDFCMREDL